MYNQINDAMFDCLLMGQYLAENGWKIEKKDGETRLQIKSKIIVSKGNISETYYDVPTDYELEVLFQRSNV